PPLSTLVTLTRGPSNLNRILISLGLHPEPLTQRIKRVAFVTQLGAGNLQRVDRLPRPGWSPSVKRPVTPQYALVKAVHIMADRDVGLVEPLPHGADELLVPAIEPLGREHRLAFVVPLRGGTDGAGPLDHIVCVDAASDGVLPGAEVPEVPGDGESPVLHCGNTGEPLDVYYEHPDLFLCGWVDPLSCCLRETHIGSQPRRRSRLIVE